MRRRLQDERAHAVARVDQAPGLQLRERLAHHRAAHAPLAHDLGFGRQLVAGAQRAAADALADAFDQLAGKVAQAAARARFRERDLGIALRRGD